MLPNVMVLASLQKLKIKYELSYQSTTRLKYIDKGVGMIRAEIGLKNRQIINETYSFRCSLII